MNVDIDIEGPSKKSYCDYLLNWFLYWMFRDIKHIRC